MTLWEQSRDEYMQTQRPRAGGSYFQQSNTDRMQTSSQSSQDNNNTGNSIKVDDVEMFIASNVNKKDYFVLL